MNEELPEHVAANREAWDRLATDYIDSGRRAWAQTEPTWGIWNVPESEIRLLPDDLEGKDAIELGCGTAYVSAWLARRGARVVGIDNSPKQLESARAFQRELDLSSRSSSATPSASRTRMPASISQFRNTAPRYGPTHTRGFRRRAGSSDPAAGSCFLRTVC